MIIDFKTRKVLDPNVEEDKNYLDWLYKHQVARRCVVSMDVNGYPLEHMLLVAPNLWTGQFAAVAPHDNPQPLKAQIYLMEETLRRMKQLAVAEETIRTLTSFKDESANDEPKDPS